jgi:hypothetical protein
MRHNLKIEKNWLDAVATGAKKAEIRNAADRDFALGDELLLYTPDKTAAELVRVTHVLCLDDIPGFKNDAPFVSLSIERERVVSGPEVDAELELGDYGR